MLLKRQFVFNNNSPVSENPREKEKKSSRVLEMSFLVFTLIRLVPGYDDDRCRSVIVVQPALTYYIQTEHGTEE